MSSGSIHPDKAHPPGFTVRRGRTAIGRADFSRPVRLALEAGLLPPGTGVFDYGCGRGHDLDRLAEAGYDVAGWDPNHRPQAERKTAEVVNLGYVVNVIEDPRERAEALKAAWGLAEGVLVVAARMSHEIKQLADGGDDFADGTLTSRSTFQKFFAQSELRAWLDEALPEDAPPAVPAAPGVFFVFRDPLRRQGFIASRYSRRRAVPKVRQSDRLFEQHRELLEPLMAFVADRGRLPAGAEAADFAEVTAALGSPKRAMAIVRRVTGPEQWDAGRAARREELLLYLALSRFSDVTSQQTPSGRRGRRRIGRPKLSELPESLRHDMRDFFGTYAAACAEGDTLLFAAGDRTRLEEATVASPVGKKLPGALYVHADTLDRLPLLLRVYEGCARSYLGSVDDANVIKLNRLDPKVSYLCYPTFDREAHPALAWSMRVAMGFCDVKSRDFRESPNPPVLHRKETFLAADDDRYERYRRLTEREEKAGLFNDGSSIGTRTGWEAALSRSDYIVRGHRLVRRTS